jgi:DNA-binding response OmpR family regulator
VLRASIARILEEEGYTVDDAADGAAALHIVDDDPPDAILLDVMMPGMNGKQFLQQLRDDGREIPVVMMTALQGLGSDRLVELGADDLVEKPFDVDELLNKVALALYRRGELDTMMDRPAVPREGGPLTLPPEAEAPAMAGTVLMLDHDHDLLASFDRQLAARGFTMVALSRLSADLPRLAIALEPAAIFLELDGPSIDGMEVLRDLRAQPALGRIPILMCVNDETKLEAVAQEIRRLDADYAVKPRDIDRALKFVDDARRA